MAFYHWSKIANNNQTADPTVNFAEGQAPSSLNDSNRAAMARLREWGNDISGSIVTGGTSTAYTVSSNQIFDTLAHLGGQLIAFTPHTTNGAGPVKLNVDGLGLQPLRSAPNVELQPGVLIQGTPYVAVYNATDGAFYLQGFYGNPYNIPLAGGLDYWGGTTPNSSFAFANGQAISRTTYAALFAIIGTTYGAGDGSTTFNLPDKRGRVSAAVDGTGRLTAATMSPGGASLGAVSTGSLQGETITLLNSNLPPYTPAGSVGSALINGGSTLFGFTTPGSNVGFGGASTGGAQAQVTSFLSVSSSFTGVAQGGTSTPIGNVQPTIMCNYIMRII